MRGEAVAFNEGRIDALEIAEAFSNEIVIRRGEFRVVGRHVIRDIDDRVRRRSKVREFDQSRNGHRLVNDVQPEMRRHRAL